MEVRSRPPAPWVRLMIFGGITIGSIALLILLMRNGMLDEGYLTALLEPLGPWTAPLFVVFYSLATMIWAPGMLLALVAVSLFAPLPAILLSLCGYLLGGTGSFYLSRVLGRAALKRTLEGRASRFATMSDRFRENAFTHVMFLRILGLPNNVASYLSGASGVSWWTYAAGTVAGIAPGLVFITLLGGSVLRVLRSGSFEALWGPETAWTLLALGIAVVAGLIARHHQRHRTPHEESAS